MKRKASRSIAGGLWLAMLLWAVSGAAAQGSGHVDVLTIEGRSLIDHLHRARNTHGRSRRCPRVGDPA
jgi:hypothetical protein